MDPLAEITFRWTPYRYGFNNPLRFVDEDGLTEKERIAAVNFARLQVGKSNYDCSALLATAVINAGLKNLKTGSGIKHGNTVWNNGVALIVSNVKVSSLDNIRMGDAVTFSSGQSKGPDGIYDHIALVSEIVYNDNKIAGFWLIHGGTSKGIQEQYYDLERGLPGFALKGVFQWDTPDEEDKEGKLVNPENPVKISGVTVMAKGPKQPESIEGYVRPNAYGNTGQYNKPGRNSDQYYSDEFLKSYYNIKD